MMKHRSSVELFPSDYFFAVYPVSLYFQRQYKTRLHFYFQKNLQIISKHQCPLESVKKDQTVHFAQPQQTHHFRVQSQKNLDYSWSLYILGINDDEQFIEGQKITLKQQWALFKSNKQCVFEQNLRFNTIRCRLDYVVIIGNNNQQVLDLAYKYFEQKASAITTDEKVVPAKQQNQGQEKVEGLKVQSNQYVPPQSKVMQNVQKEQQNRNAQKITKQQSKSIEEMKISAVVQHCRHSLQLNFSPESKQVKSIQNLLSPRDEQNIKLTNSQMEIGIQIEEIVITKEADLKGQNNKNFQQVIKASQQTEEKNIRLIKSQLLNEKKQVIEPPYKRVKLVIALALLTVLIFGGGFWVLSKKRSPVVQINNKKSKGVRGQAKQVPNKKGKNKK